MERIQNFLDNYILHGDLACSFYLKYHGGSQLQRILAIPPSFSHCTKQHEELLSNWGHPVMVSFHTQTVHFPENKYWLGSFRTEDNRYILAKVGNRVHLPVHPKQHRAICRPSRQLLEHVHQPEIRVPY